VDKLTFTQAGVGFGFLLLCLVATVQIATLVNIRRQHKREDEFATKSEIARVDKKVEDLRQDIVKNGDARRIAIEGKVEAARMEAREDTESIKRDVARLGHQVSAVEATARMINQTMGQIALTRRDK
jgi:hypothetical protein